MLATTDAQRVNEDISSCRVNSSQIIIFLSFKNDASDRKFHRFLSGYHETSHSILSLAPFQGGKTLI